MKNKDWRYGVILFCFVGILVVFALLLMGCEDNQDFCWRCEYTETSQREGFEINSWTSVYDLCGKNQKEILQYDADNTGNYEYLCEGEKYLATTKCHCMKKTCW